jgi:hypothetical protein
MRVPTDHELARISGTRLVEQGYNQADAYMVAQNAYVAVFEHYQTGSPGYVGKVMTVVWDGWPSTFNVFTWDGDKMEEQVHELTYYAATPKSAYSCSRSRFEDPKPFDFPLR